MDLGQVVIVSAVICAVLGAAIGSGKGYAGLGLILGALLGVIGLVIIAIAKPSAEHLAATAPPARDGGWWPDPHGRYAQRYYDGTAWTNHVLGVDGQQTTDA